jgi:hypothetical protein
MGYQESKWDPGATSHTGVRGLMQLTEDTADFVRAGDRLDARASIFGGAKYLSRLLATIPERIAEPDRTWLAVARYNVGYGHLEDARILAQQAGRNADAGQDVREFLPLLSQERWYTRTRRGYARGWEPVRYVENVQSYLNILEVSGIGAPAIASATAPTRSRVAGSRRDALSGGVRLRPDAVAESRSSTSRGEELAQQRPHSSASTPALTSSRMIERGMLHDVEDTAGGADARSPRTVRRGAALAREPSPGAHRTRLKRHVQRGVEQPIVPEKLTARAQAIIPRARSDRRCRSDGWSPRR